MARIKQWKAYKDNVSLNKFCREGATCPMCGSELECQEEKQNTISVCSSCDYMDNGGE